MLYPKRDKRMLGTPAENKTASNPTNASFLDDARFNGELWAHAHPKATPNIYKHIAHVEKLLNRDAQWESGTALDKAPTQRLLTLASPQATETTGPARRRQHVSTGQPASPVHSNRTVASPITALHVKANKTIEKATVLAVGQLNGKQYKRPEGALRGKTSWQAPSGMNNRQTQALLLQVLAPTTSVLTLDKTLTTLSSWATLLQGNERLVQDRP
eukprot:g37780.t1